MSLNPFVILPTPRLVAVNLPSDLSEFYRHHEGVGLEASPDANIRLCKLHEVRHVDFSDIHVLQDRESNDWRAFRGIRIGIDSWLDDVVYVLDAPNCALGAIMLLGPDVASPEGAEGSLVLAESLLDWLSNLELHGWVEYGTCPGGLQDISPNQRRIIVQRLNNLNPGLELVGG